MGVLHGRAIRVPAGSLKWICTACPAAANITLPSVVLEPLVTGNSLPAGILVSSALLSVHPGRIEIPVVNALDLSSLSWSNLSSKQTQQGLMLLQKHSTAFSQGEGDLGCTTLVEHEIPLVDVAPVWQCYRRLPPSQYEQVKTHIQELLDRGVGRPSCSPYFSPIIVVFKKNGEIRCGLPFAQCQDKKGCFSPASD